jgi:hypothetical protein
MTCFPLLFIPALRISGDGKFQKFFFPGMKKRSFTGVTKNPWKGQSNVGQGFSGNKGAPQ